MGGGDRVNPVEMIERKREGACLTSYEIAQFVKAVTDGSFQDCQLGAMLMAIYLKGMSPEETVALTMEMARSGDMLDLSGIQGIKVDKHSTGGVGDTTTLVLAPLVAACGAKVAKMSGRGLGHTGGTLDKLESIPGMSVSLTGEQFIRQVNQIGLAVIGQSGDLAPADKRLYALRDVTATVGSLPLVVSSILSKKIASGTDAVVLDVKAGSGAIMPTLEKSLELARTMVDIGCRAGRKFSALVTDMDQPLGMYIGNALEVEEAIDVLSGRVQGPLKEVSLQLGGHMLLSAGLAQDMTQAVRMLEEAIRSGAGLRKLGDMIEWQGGDRRVAQDTGLLPKAPLVESLPSPATGYIAHMDTAAIGNAARALGAGRVRKDDAIDPAVGLVMKVRLGDYVEKGQPLLDMHIGQDSKKQACQALLDGAFVFAQQPPAPRPLIYEAVYSR